MIPGTTTKKAFTIIPGATPTIKMHLSDDTIDLGEAENVYVTLSQGATEITKTGEYVAVDGNRINAWLEQEDTLNLREGAAKLQINWTYYEGSRLIRTPTYTTQIWVDEQLLRRVIK